MCVRLLYVVFCHHVHLDPEIQVARYMFTATRKTLLDVIHYIKYPQKIFNEQRSRDAAAKVFKKRANTSGVGKIYNYC